MTNQSTSEDPSGIDYQLPIYNITFVGPHDLDKDLAKLMKNPILDSNGNSFFNFYQLTTSKADHSPPEKKHPILELGEI